MRNWHATHAKDIPLARQTVPLLQKWLSFQWLSSPVEMNTCVPARNLQQLSLASSAVVVEGSKGAWGQEGQHGTLSPGPWAAKIGIRIPNHSPAALHWYTHGPALKSTPTPRDAWYYLHKQDDLDLSPCFSHLQQLKTSALDSNFQLYIWMDVRQLVNCIQATL